MIIDEVAKIISPIYLVGGSVRDQLLNKIPKDNEKCHHTKYSFIESIRNNRIIGTAIWKEFREAILKRDKCVCNYCRKKANEIHHIKSRREFPKLCFNKGNVVSVCTPCHLSIEPKYQRQILQYDLEGNFIREWKSVQEAQYSFNDNSTNVWFCLNKYKGQETAYGFKWKYKHLDRAKKKPLTS